MRGTHQPTRPASEGGNDCHFSVISQVNHKDRSMKWSSNCLRGCHLAERKKATLRLSGGCHLTERSWMEAIYSNVSFLRKVPSLACTTTPCPTAGWPPVTWKGSGAHVPLSVQAARALLAATPD
ncbi:unnamed protein product [Spirodela intermedia]|uniref:Uncharacterized protein n=1 Tax=Spirodela intermedia TaxID=51605 RepID=A0A7I8I8R4_SPIIN|nr:unnamed protein product [Spirodela intermedia]CAA6653908.1 unnamed protein product [Spirodela intermedia]